MKAQSLSAAMALALIFVAADLNALAAQPAEENGQENQRERGGRRQGRRGGRQGFGGRGMGGMGMFGRGPGIGRAALLRSDQVREELAIDEGQAATIDAAMEAYSDERRSARPDFSRFQDMSDDERTAELERMRTAATELAKKTDETLGLLLEPEQVTRLDQILLQVRLKTNPVGAFQDPDLQEKLTVTEEQAGKLSDVEAIGRERMEEMGQKMREGFQSGERPDFEKMREDGQKLNEELTDLALAVLNDEQTTQMKELQGEDFELDMGQLAPRGRGGRGGFGGIGRGGGRGDGGGGRGGNRERRRRPESEPAGSDE